jgi:uncharacterized membrane protein
MVRFIVGLLLVYGAVGGMDHQPEYFTEQAALAVLGLCLMWWGTIKMQHRP